MCARKVWSVVVLAMFVALCRSDKRIQRLPRAIWPSQYNLTIHTDPQGRNFSGNVSIDVEARENSDNLTLNAGTLTLGTPLLVEKNTQVEVPISAVNKTSHTLTLLLKSPLLKSGRYTLHLPFRGLLNTAQRRGYYRLRTGQSENQWMTGTVFEYINARDAFPCFDEPEFKARFQISLSHHRNLTALSNMPVERSELIEDNEDWVIDHFQNSPVMSTYLVAFHLHRLDSRETTTDEGRSVKVWAPSRQLRWANVTLDIAPKAIRFLQDYTAVPDPLPKVDFISVPRFPGALENWGVISLMPTAVLYKPHGEGEMGRVLNTKVVIHELAHTWFGNLVTPEWWDGLWLSEGAATFFASLAMDQMEPEWDQMTEDTQDHLSSTFFSNAVPSSKALGHPIECVNDLRAVSYSPYFKGFSLLRMLYLSLGPQRFQEGIRRYLFELQYKTTTPQFLFEAMQYSYKGMDLTKLMDSWVYREGLPVVSVNRSDNQLSLTQERFMAVGLGFTSRVEVEEKSWWIPISLTFKSEKNFKDPRPKLWFSEDISVPDPARPDDWVVVNVQAAGTYHVRYDNNNLELLKMTLNSSQDDIPPLNRMQLVLDYGLFALAGLEPLPKVLDLLDFLSREQHFAPWAVGLNNLWRMNQRLRGTPAGLKFKERVQKLLAPELSRLGLRTRKGDKVPVIRQRRQIVQHACLYRIADCTRRAERLFNKWTEQTQPEKVNPIPSDLRLTVYCTSIKAGNQNNWNFLKERALQSRDPVHRDAMFTALGCTDQYELLYSFMEDKLENSTVSRHDFTKLLQGLVQFNDDIGPVLDFMERSMLKMKSSSKKKLRWNQSMLKDLSQQFVEPSQLEKLKNLVSSGRISSESEIAKIEQMMEHNLDWREKNKNIL